MFNSRKEVCIEMIINRILNFIGYRFINLALDFDNRHQYPKKEEERYKKDDPYEMLRVTYPLTEKSLVVDIGGLTGDWAARIYCRYSCRIHIYEPHPILSRRATMNFEGNQGVIIFPFGLSSQNGLMDLYGDFYNASLYKNDYGTTHTVRIRKAYEVFKDLYSNQTIDLLKLNVEGAEYDILPDLIRDFDMTRIKNIQIQFHQTVEGHAEKREAIRQGLIKTHRMTWGYDYIFENWEVLKK